MTLDEIRAARAAGRHANKAPPPPPAVIAAPINTAPVASLPIRRLTADQIDPWLLHRLNNAWPGRSDTHWRGLFRGFEASNDYLCIQNDRAVLLAERKPQPMTAVPMAVVIFGWLRDPVNEDDVDPDIAQPMIDLYVRCRRWLAGMGGEHLLWGLSDDLPGDFLMDAM